MLTPLAGATPTKPGSACLPFFGIRPVIVDKETHTPLPADAPGAGLLCFDVPWPGMMRTVYGDHERFITTYLKLCPGASHWRRCCRCCGWHSHWHWH